MTVYEAIIPRWHLFIGGVPKIIIAEEEKDGNTL